MVRNIHHTTRGSLSTALVVVCLTIVGKRCQLPLTQIRAGILRGAGRFHGVMLRLTL